MAKDNQQNCRYCRREGVKLFLKSNRCLGQKCPIDKQGLTVPGYHSLRKRRQNISEYGTQLREKQKVRRSYGVLEHQFKRYYKAAHKAGGQTGENLLRFLESRLDNVVYRLGFTISRSEARQLVLHRHIFVNNIRVNIPSYQVKPGDVVSLSPKAVEFPFVKETLAKKDVIIPEWLKRKAFIGKVERLVNRDEIDGDLNEQLVVEYYSR